MPGHYFWCFRAAHCGEGLSHSTYTALKQNCQHWVFSLFLETENFFHMLGIVSDPKPDVDSFQQHQSRLEEVSKPLWNCLGWLWCILALPAVLPWVLGNFWELVEHKAGRHCHCLVKREKQRSDFVGTRVPPLVSSLWRSMERRHLERSAQLLHGCVTVPVLVARLQHVCVMAKGCGPLWMYLGEEPNTAAGDRAVTEGPVSRWLLALIW